MEKKKIQEEIALLEGEVAGYHNLIRVTRSNISNQEFVQRSIADHEAKIQWHQKMIDDLKSSIESGPQIIADAQASLVKLRSRINRLKHKRDIDRVLELQRLMNQLQEGIDEDGEEPANESE